MSKLARYLTMGGLCSLATVLAIFQFGLSVQTLFALFFAIAAIALSFIDAFYQLLPNIITLPMLGLGILINTQHLFTSFWDAVFGAALAYSLFWLTATLFKWIRRCEGLGRGDFKCFAMIGAWVGASNLIPTLLLATLSGLVIAGIILISQRESMQQRIPFGPYLVASGYLVLLYGSFFRRLF